MGDGPWARRQRLQSGAWGAGQRAEEGLQPDVAQRGAGGAGQRAGGPPAGGARCATAVGVNPNKPPSCLLLLRTQDYFELAASVYIDLPGPSKLGAGPSKAAYEDAGGWLEAPYQWRSVGGT